MASDPGMQEATGLGLDPEDHRVSLPAPFLVASLAVLPSTLPAPFLVASLAVLPSTLPVLRRAASLVVLPVVLPVVHGVVRGVVLLKLHLEDPQT